jgi:hypothetical protein
MLFKKMIALCSDNKSMPINTLYGRNEKLQNVTADDRHAPDMLYPREKTPVPTGQEVGWAREPVWTQRLEQKSFASAGVRTSIARWSSPQSDTILTELPRPPNKT